MTRGKVLGASMCSQPSCGHTLVHHGNSHLNRCRFEGCSCTCFLARSSLDAVEPDRDCACPFCRADPIESGR